MTVTVFVRQGTAAVCVTQLRLPGTEMKRDKKQSLREKGIAQPRTLRVTHERAPIAHMHRETTPVIRGVRKLGPGSLGNRRLFTLSAEMCATLSSSRAVGPRELSHLSLINGPLGALH